MLSESEFVTIILGILVIITGLERCGETNSDVLYREVSADRKLPTVIRVCMPVSEASAFPHNVTRVISFPCT